MPTRWPEDLGNDPFRLDGPGSRFHEGLIDDGQLQLSRDVAADGRNRGSRVDQGRDSFVFEPDGTGLGRR